MGLCLRAVVARCCLVPSKSRVMGNTTGERGSSTHNAEQSGAVHHRESDVRRQSEGVAPFFAAEAVDEGVGEDVVEGGVGGVEDGEVGRRVGVVVAERGEGVGEVLEVGLAAVARRRQAGEGVAGLAVGEGPRVHE
eukprot:CAMPEP_0198665530 /NCGR_PEP_ID=MMETSP1467-20131203/60778_1 /TAXON_ID=1462469 /ORGANISM="unid. sp., Strain CCMP2135" /LENGTH=135 /DNA_ID=CAMNT_0044402125 /DNA_START=57 /DNA_END=464 /DNA_ORIENTATION=+